MISHIPRRLAMPALLATILLALLGGPSPGLTSTADAQATSPWQQATPFQNGRTSASSVRIGDRVYLIGGYQYDSVAQQLNVYNDVQWATLDPNGGMIGGWHQTTPFNTPRLGQSAVRHGRYIYVVGGGDGNIAYYDDVQYAKVGDDGDITVAGWQTSPHHLNYARAALTTEVHTVDGQAYIYAIGGAGSDAQGNTIHFASVEYAKIHDDGSIGPWRVSPNQFQKPRSSQDTAFVNGCLYVVGGFGDRFEDIFSDVQYACVQPNGSLSPWTTSPNSMHQARYGAEMIVQRPRRGPPQFVVIGGDDVVFGSGGSYLNEIERSDVSGPAGNGPWHVAPQKNWLPQPQWGQTGVTYRGFVDVLGGVTQSQAYLSEAKYARIAELFRSPASCTTTRRSPPRSESSRRASGLSGWWSCPTGGW